MGRRAAGGEGQVGEGEGEEVRGGATSTKLIQWQLLGLWICGSLDPGQDPLIRGRIS